MYDYSLYFYISGSFGLPTHSSHNLHILEHYYNFSIVFRIVFLWETIYKRLYIDCAIFGNVSISLKNVTSWDLIIWIYSTLYLCIIDCFIILLSTFTNQISSGNSIVIIYFIKMDENNSLRNIKLISKFVIINFDANLKERPASICTKIIRKPYTTILLLMLLLLF